MSWFLLEFLLRLLTCPDRRRFLTGCLNMIDLVALLPYLLSPLLVRLEAVQEAGQVPGAGGAGGQVPGAGGSGGQGPGAGGAGGQVPGAGGAGGQVQEVGQILRILRVVRVLKVARSVGGGAQGERKYKIMRYFLLFLAILYFIVEGFEYEGISELL